VKGLVLEKLWARSVGPGFVSSFSLFLAFSLFLVEWLFGAGF